MEDLVQPLWLIAMTLSATLSYLIARDRSPDKSLQAVLWGYLLGPFGVAITFLITQKVDTSDGYERPPTANTKSVEEIRNDLDRLRSNLE